MTTDIAVPQIETTGDSLTQVRRARQSLFIFAIFLIPLSSFGFWVWVTFPDAPFILPTLAFSLSPGLASALTRLVRREGFADVSFRLRGPHMGSAFLLALGLPLIVGAVAYGFAYLVGLAKFDPPPFPVAVSSPLGQFGAIMAFSIIGIVLILIPDAGEEIGWRGYMLPRMVEARLPQPVALSALVWGTWHLPVLFASVYAVGPSHFISATGLIVATFAFGSYLAWLRLSTGSVWPCVIAHAAWNSMINGGFTLATHNPTANMWIGENGILVALTLVIAALLLKRYWKPFLSLN